jgi:hypothetical protein
MVMEQQEQQPVKRQASDADHQEDKAKKSKREAPVLEEELDECEPIPVDDYTLPKSSEDAGMVDVLPMLCKEYGFERVEELVRSPAVERLKNLFDHAAYSICFTKIAGDASTLNSELSEQFDFAEIVKVSHEQYFNSTVDKDVQKNGKLSLILYPFEYVSTVLLCMLTRGKSIPETIEWPLIRVLNANKDCEDEDGASAIPRSYVQLLFKAVKHVTIMLVAMHPDCLAIRSQKEFQTYDGNCFRPMTREAVVSRVQRTLAAVLGQ